MNKKFESLKNSILKMDDIPQSEALFGVANLIVSDDPNRNRKEEDIFVLTKYPREVSWFVFQLKEIFLSEFDGTNKYSFYPKSVIY